jgi:Fic family protein
MGKEYPQIVEKWNGQKLAAADEIDAALYNFRILFAYNSGKIENERIEYADTHDIFERGKVSSFTGDIRTLFEQQNQKDCYDFLREKIASREPVTIDLIKRIHYELTKGTYDERRYAVNAERPGEFKKHDYVVGKNEAGLPPDLVEGELGSVIAELNEAGQKNVLTAGAYLHAMFENIHPFADGNGRAGRTLMNYYLMTHAHPPIIIYEEDRRQYYAALNAFDTDEDLNPLIGFLTAECEKTWARQYSMKNISIKNGAFGKKPSGHKGK